MLSTDSFHKNSFQDNTAYIITEAIDLKGKTIIFPQNCTLIFKNGGNIKNGTIVGNNTKIEYNCPFIGEDLVLKDCTIKGKRKIKDSEVFLTVSHTQYEIQTLFNLSDGIRIVFSKGVYKNIEKVEVNNNIEANFNNSTIQLYYNKEYVGECFYMEPWIDKHIDYFKINNVRIIGQRYGLSGSKKHRSCIQLFYVSEVVLDGVELDKFYGGPDDYKTDESDLQDKSRIGTSAINIIHYDKCIIKNCITNDISKEIFWCVPNNCPHNITYFLNNKSTCSTSSGSASFFTIIDGRCIVKNNEVHNYNGSAFNAFCYDSEISFNKFYDGKRSIAIDLSEGTRYRAKNVYVHNNECFNTKAMLYAYGGGIKVVNNRWLNTKEQAGKRIYVITIASRGEREKGRYYIGSDNNPEQDTESREIYIAKNIINNFSDNRIEIRAALLYGVDIAYSNNNMLGLNAPVVQLDEGRQFNYTRNTIKDSKPGKYAELLINNVYDVKIDGNIFGSNCFDNEKRFTVQILKAKGKLSYNNKGVINDSHINNSKLYIPCLVKDDTELKQAEVFVSGVSKEIRMSSGIKNNLILKTNIK